MYVHGGGWVSFHMNKLYFAKKRVKSIVPRTKAPLGDELFLRPLYNTFMYMEEVSFIIYIQICYTKGIQKGESIVLKEQLHQQEYDGVV